MQHTWTVGSWVFGIAVGSALASCGGDLGKCDMTMLGGSEVAGMLAPHDGQSLINNSCAGGTCHSKGAKNDSRMGAPAGLNFDVVPATADVAETTKVNEGAATVKDEADEMWDEINEGVMPPDGKRSKLAAADKESIRNWLACNSPVVNAPVSVAPSTADLASIYTALSSMACKSCHTSGSDGTFLSGATPCDGYNALVSKPAVGSGCGTSGQMLVVPGNPDQSLLLHKLNGTQTCGMSMPFGGVPLAMTDPALVQNIQAWIMAGAPKPTGCL